MSSFYSFNIKTTNKSVINRTDAIIVSLVVMIFIILSVNGLRIWINKTPSNPQIREFIRQIYLPIFKNFLL